MNIPNALSIFRIIMIPFFVIFFETRWVAVLIFSISVLTDTLDGLIARIRDSRTKLGSILDPLADKLLILTAFFLLTINGEIPIVFTLIVFLRDILIVLGWTVLYIHTNLKQAIPSVLGKLANAFQVISIFLFLIKWINLAFVFSYVMLFITIISGVGYIVKGIRKLSEA